MNEYCCLARSLQARFAAAATSLQNLQLRQYVLCLCNYSVSGKSKVSENLTFILNKVSFCRLSAVCVIAVNATGRGIHSKTRIRFILTRSGYNKRTK